MYVYPVDHLSKLKTLCLPCTRSNHWAILPNDEMCLYIYINSSLLRMFSCVSKACLNKEYFLSEIKLIFRTVVLLFNLTHVKNCYCSVPQYQYHSVWQYPLPFWVHLYYSPKLLPLLLVRFFVIWCLISQEKKYCISNLYRFLHMYQKWDRNYAIDILFISSFPESFHK